MKRTLAAVLAICLVAVILCGCGAAEAPVEEPTTSNPTTPAAPVDDEANTEPDVKEDDGVVEPPKGFPNKEITVIVPVAAGGSFDTYARLMAKCVKDLYGVNMVVTNVEGGSGLTGMTQLITSKPDGYTICFYTMTFVGNSVMGRYEGVGLDDVDYIATATADRITLVVNKDSGITDFDGFVEAVKAADGKFSIGETGSYNGQYAAVCSLSEKIFGEGIIDKIVPVTFTGGIRVMADLMGDATINAGIGKPVEWQSGYEAGELVPIAVLSDGRTELAPDVPTLNECGYGDIEFLSLADSVDTTLIYCPAGIPEDVAAYLEYIITGALNSEEFTSYVESCYAVPKVLSGDELDAFIETTKDIFMGFKEDYFPDLQ